MAMDSVGTGETSMPWKVVDLFSGPGGMSWGFRSLPEYFQIVGAADIEVGKPGLKKSQGTRTFCNATYARNIGIEPKNVDLAFADARDLRLSFGVGRGELTVLISCAPCTGFSQKNANNHVQDDPRNHLVQRSGEFVEEFLPEFFVMENVKELLRGKQTHHFRELNAILQRLGYTVWAEIHNLTAFGLPQSRTRALIIARRDGKPVPGLPPALDQSRTVRDAIGGLRQLGQGEVDPNDPMHVCPRHTDVVTKRMKAIPVDGGSWGDIVQTHPDLLIPSMRNKRAGSFPDVYGRMSWDRPAPTITRECASPGNGRYTHPEQHRLLSVREMACLQGFPEDYYFEGHLTQKYNQIGDAVPPLISRQIAEHIVRIKHGQVEAVHQSSMFALAGAEQT